MKKSLAALAVLISACGYAQVSDTVIRLLQMDTSYAILQYYDPQLAGSLKTQLDNTNKDKFVIYHYGGSHIQAGMPPKVAREKLQLKYGNGGLGMIFSYSAANTYSSVLYSSAKTGEWIFGKSYVNNPKVPLGVCGMAVETAQSGATLDFRFKEPVPRANNVLRVLTDVDSTNFGFELTVNNTVYTREDLRYVGSGMFEIETDTEIASISLKTVKEKNEQQHFRFYGIDIEYKFNTGLIYHSLGVGAAAFRSVLQLEKMPFQSETLKPDMVILDFGTNDILYTNAIDPKLAPQVEKAIADFRKINPQILVVLTSTQDLYKKGKYISAGVEFVTLIDSLARKNNCFFWNWYDLAGGYGTITNWRDLKYAKSDCIHLTPAGYEIKGDFIYKSILNTVKAYESNPAAIVSVAQKPVDFTANAPAPAPAENPSRNTAVKTYVVRSGDTLSGIAAKTHSTVARIKKANGLRSDRISIGQRLKIPR